MADQHHRYSPSKLDRIAQCPGSVRMAELYQRDSSPHADEGTLLHAVMAARLRGERGPEITPEQEALVQVGFQELAKIGAPVNPVIEQKMVLKDWMGNLVTDGTADLWWVEGSGGTVNLVDWKFGRVPVSANSMQFSAYAQMVYQSCDCYGVNVYVIMPRLEKTFHAYITPGAWLEDELTSLIRDCERPGMHLRHGPECVYCPAAHDCPEARAASHELAVVDPCALDTADKLADALQIAEAASAIIDRAGKRIASIRAEAVKWLSAGKALDGWDLKPGRRTVECVDIAGAFAASGMPADTFLRACTLSVSKLAGLHAEVTGTGERVARREIEARLAETLAEKRGEYQLIRK